MNKIVLTYYIRNGVTTFRTEPNNDMCNGATAVARDIKAENIVVNKKGKREDVRQEDIDPDHSQWEIER